MKPSVNPAWGVLAATSVMISLSMALPIYGGSVTTTYMAVALGWKREILGLLVAANMVANALCAPLAAISIGRFGVRGTMVVGSALIGLAGVALATIVTLPWQALIAFGLVIGGGSALAGIIPCQAAVAAWFDGRRTMALSIMYAAQGLGGFLAAFLINNAIFASGTWRSGWWVFAIAGALGVLVAALFVRDAPDGADAPAGAQPSPSNEMAGPGEVQQAIIKGALGSPLLWATYVCMLTLMVGSGFIIGHAQVYLRGLGFSPSSAASAISLMSVAMVIGNLGFGAMASRVGLKATYIAAGATYCIGLVLLTQTHSYPFLWAFSLVAGTGFGAGQVGAMAMLGHYWSTRAFPALTALGLLLQTAGGGMAPILAGAYFDSHGTYLPVIWTLAAMNFVSAAFLLAVVIGQSGGAATAAKTPVAGANPQS